MALHPWKLYCGFLIGMSLWVSSVAADDRSHQRVRRAPPSAAAADQSDPWHGIGRIIHKPVERPAKWHGRITQGSQFPPEVVPIEEPEAFSNSSASDIGPISENGVVGSGSPDNASLTHDNNRAISAELLALKTKIRGVLDLYRLRRLNTRDHTPWEVMHAFVAYNVQTEILREGPEGPPVNAIGWILWGGRCRGRQLLTLSRGRPHAEEGVGVQGHPAQLLAILAQSRVNEKTPMRLGGTDFTLEDLIREEMLDCRADSELTFKLISLAHYLPSDTVWRSRDGQAWSIPRLINAEIKAPIRGAACGGTHRLFGISYAYQMRAKEGRALDGEFLRAKQYIASYHRYTRTLQNPDGSFSTEWFSRRANRPDIDRKLQTTGHITEWLIGSFADEQLQDPMLLKSVDFLATSLANEPNRTWSIGPLGHALHALLMYDERAFPSGMESPGSLAEVSPKEAVEADGGSAGKSDEAAETAAAEPVERGPLLKLQ